MTRKQLFAFLLQASIIVLFLAGSAAPTPLYAVYQQAWGFSPITVTIVFGTYAVAVLAALLVFGSLSDHVGRRPVLIVAALVQAGAMILFATAHGVGALVAARLVQGLGTGAAAGAVGAGLLDLDRARGTTANAIAPMLGTALGGSLAGVLVTYAPLPTQLVYLVLGVLFVAQAIGISRIAETAPLADRTPAARRAAALAALRPKFALPPAVRRPLLVAAPALVASWALIGFYASLGPTLVRRLVGSDSLVLGGGILTLLAGAGAATVWILRARLPRNLMIAGTALLAVGTALTLVGIAERAVAVFVVGAALSGAGFGASFQGAVRSVVSLAAPHERAGLLSIVYVIAYLAMGVPAVFGGLRVVATRDLFATAHEYGLAVILLAALALAGTLAPALVRRRAPAAA